MDNNEQTHSTRDEHRKAGCAEHNTADASDASDSYDSNASENANDGHDNDSSDHILSKPDIKLEVEPTIDEVLLSEQTEANNNSNISDTPNPKVLEQLRHLAKAFAQRGEEVKRRISQPIQTSSEESICTDSKLLVEEEWMNIMDITRVSRYKKTALKELWSKVKRRRLGVFEPQSSLYISWLFVVSLAFIYNAVVLLLRSVFPYETPANRVIFFIFDYICDTIYAIDMIWIKARLKFILNGQWVEDIELTRKNYIQKNRFIWDCLSLLPLDLFYFIYGFDEPLLRLLRLNRLIKFKTFIEFFNRLDANTNSPYLIRIIHCLIYMFYMIHLSTCAYYLMSSYEGFGSTPWTYNKTGNAYLRCFYFAFRTATSIGGRMPKPSNNLERVYMIVSWLMGVFVFALIIGQIRDIVATATQSSTNYRDVVNQTVRYMRNLHVPHDLQKRVRLWLSYTWAQHKTFDENQILELLPLKMRTDLVLSMHYKTLSQVELFKGCDRSFIRELVLKFKSEIFLPGDYICRKNEIGHEMYIISSGQVCVVDSDQDNKVLATLSEGSVFGEISILGISGFNRRTADVMSVGYSNLFVLSKKGLEETLKLYPEYQEALKDKVRKLIKVREAVEDSSKMEEIDVDSVVNAVPRTPTPRMVHTVMQLISPDSRISKMLSRSSRSSASSNTFMSPMRSSETTIDMPENNPIEDIAVTEFTVNPSPDSVEVFEDKSEEKSEDESNEENSRAIDNQFITDIIYKF